MKLKIFEGSLSVIAAHNVESLDTPVTKLNQLTFTLKYPFEKPFEGHVQATSGISLRMILEAIAAGFQKMYENTRDVPIPGMSNRLITGAFGTSFHSLSDLRIEKISVDEETGVMTVAIGS